MNQSIPFSYLSVEVVANDGKSHHVQLYTDISGEWLAQSDQNFQWETTAGSTVNHQFQLQNQTQLTEVNGRLRDGYVMYSTKQVAVLHEILSEHFSNGAFQVDGMTYQVGEDTLVRPLFETTGVLNNTVDQQFREIGDRWPVFAFAHDLGNVGTTKTTPVVYIIGYVRDPLVQISNVPNINSVRGPYYMTRYGSVPGMVRSLHVSWMVTLTCSPQVIALLDDYPNTLARATSFDAKLTSDALAAASQNSDYANIVALSVRQLFANIELTSGWDGTTHVPTDIMAFMRGAWFISVKFPKVV